MLCAFTDRVDLKILASMQQTLRTKNRGIFRAMRPRRFHLVGIVTLRSGNNRQVLYWFTDKPPIPHGRCYEATMSTATAGSIFMFYRGNTVLAATYSSSRPPHPPVTL